MRGARRVPPVLSSPPVRRILTLDANRRLRNALETARKQLLAGRAPGGHWVGQLSSSALSTATAVCALALVDRASRTANHESRCRRGLEWLASHVNADGGWGDTPLSLSNISTTTLCWAAFGAVPDPEKTDHPVVRNARRWLSERAGDVTPEKLAPAIIQRYGKDRTFSVPILTTCVLSGRFGSRPDAWKWVLPLPFELAAFPHSFFAALHLPVVSYALPALIAIGQARHHHLPSRNPFARWVRSLTRSRTLAVLEQIQPSSGGFLEATPLTSFVTMSLAGSGQAGLPVTRKGVEFLIAAQRSDGSWPIDTNLATWVTTLSVNALAGDPSFSWPHGEQRAICDWLLRQQFREVHRYTNAAPGGWAWTDLPGGVPDADDTAGALLALKRLASTSSPRTRDTTPWSVGQMPAGPDHADEGPGEPDLWQGAPAPSISAAEGEKPPKANQAGGVADGRNEILSAATAGIIWLLDLQNSDGGIPTFCRGWTNLPFDRSAPDLTAHALRAWVEWLPELPDGLQRRLRKAIERGVRHLASAQRPDGSWIPLWFGNQHSADETNPVYGTARVLVALAGLDSDDGTPRSASGFRLRKAGPSVSMMSARAAQWLVSVQKPDGGWGAADAGPASVEETALAVEALAGLAWRNEHAISDAILRGTNWLIERVADGDWMKPSPIGFYFARLWYFEQLYPLIFTVSALSRAARPSGDSQDQPVL